MIHRPLLSDWGGTAGMSADEYRRRRLDHVIRGLSRDAARPLRPCSETPVEVTEGARRDRCAP